MRVRCKRLLGPITLATWCFHSARERPRAGALINGSNGMSFRLKTFLMIIFEIGALITSATSCGGAQLALCDTIGLVSGYVIGHLAELHLRQAHVERRKSEARVLEEKRLPEARAEHLHASNERLLYDLQLPCRDSRPPSEIRRGLEAGPSQPHHCTTGDTDQSETSGSAPTGRRRSQR